MMADAIIMALVGVAMLVAVTDLILAIVLITLIIKEEV